MASMAKDTFTPRSGQTETIDLCEDPTVNSQHRENRRSIHSDPERMNPAYELRQAGLELLAENLTRGK